jgi:UPF0176 protein
MAALYNRVNKHELKKRLAEETLKRITVSFYRYVPIDDPNKLRDQLFAAWQELGCFGRIYVANEGINAQMSVPENRWNDFKENLYSDPKFAGVPFKIGVDGNGKSFYKLVIKVREKIVADGIEDPTFNPSDTGKYLNAQEFNEAMSDPDTIVVDMRNHYESEVGHFTGAYCPDADTFREELPQVIEHLKGKEDKKVLMYCTGGIRCEKASAYLKHKGFKDVNHLHGGIIQYAKEVKEQNLESKFIGKNFVCGEPCDNHVNCKNDDCHLLFIQCDRCAGEMNGCCTPNCKSIAAMPIEEQKKLRKGRIKNGPECLAVYKSRLRPNLAKELNRLNLEK